MEGEPSTSKKTNIKNIKNVSRKKSRGKRAVSHIRQEKRKTKLAMGGKKSLSTARKEGYMYAVSWHETLERISEKSVVSDSEDSVVSLETRGHVESPEHVRDAGYCIEEAGASSPLIRFRKEQDGQIPLDEDEDEDSNDTVVPLPLFGLKNLVSGEYEEDYLSPARKNVGDKWPISACRSDGVSGQQKVAHRALPSQTQVDESNILSASVGKRSLNKSAKLVESFANHREIQSTKGNEQSKTQEPARKQPSKSKSSKCNDIHGWWERPTDDPNDPYKISSELADEMERDPRTGQRITYAEFRRRNERNNKKSKQNDIRTNMREHHRNEVFRIESSDDESIEESPGSTPRNA